MILSFAQREILGELRSGPCLEGGLRTQTFRALSRRGLVRAVNEDWPPYTWALTAQGKRMVLSLGLVPPFWVRLRAKHRRTGSPVE